MPHESNAPSERERTLWEEAKLILVPFGDSPEEPTDPAKAAGITVAGVAVGSAVGWGVDKNIELHVQLSTGGHSEVNANITDNSLADTHLAETLGGALVITSLGLGIRYALRQLGERFRPQV